MDAVDGYGGSLPIPERFQHLLKLISSERFLKMQGLGNEVPFFICPFPPQDSVGMEQMAGQLANRLAQNGVHVLQIQLYDLCVELLTERGIWEQLLDVEPAVSKAEFMELLQGVLDVELHLVPAIAAKMAQADEFAVLFLTGIGEIFPYIRSHNVLNNLQSTAKARPTVMFFPGRYTQSLEQGASLELFGVLHDDKYYRAFNVYHIQP
ncbi:MAG: DUF1788 domain-containing protein [Caldilinea sp.]|jgi:hypothetical protein